VIWQLYNSGLDVIGGDVGTGGAPSVGQNYTDKETVKLIQGKLHALSLAKMDPSLDPFGKSKDDGIFGPDTKRALISFNTQRGAPEAGGNINDDVIVALRNVVYTPEKGREKPVTPPSGQKPVALAAALATASEPPGFFSTNVPGVDRPLWQVMLAAFGLSVTGFGLYRVIRR